MITRLIFALSLAASSQVLANGGGYFRGGIQRAGDIELFEPEEVEKIRMLDEKLTVDLGEKEARVEIRYLMKNETDGKVKVRFGFPVEELFDNDMMNEGGDTDPETSKKSDGKLKYCKDYEITVGGKKIEAKWKGEEKAGDDKRFKGIAGWLVSELSFAPGEEKAVRIAFRSGYPEEEWSVSDDSFTGASIFKYRLSTAACWAGTIGTGRIVLRPAGIQADQLKVLKPVNRFKKEGKDWVWSFENLEPAMADDIEVEAAPEKKTYWRTVDGKYDEGPRATFTERGGKWTMSHSNYKVSASSTLKPDGELRYDAEQVKDFWDELAWSEGAAGSGVGEWLEFKPEVPKPLKAIEIYPGYAKDDALFKANARPKKVLIRLNDEEEFTATIPDSKESCRLVVPDYDKPVKVVRMTFQEVWEGSKHKDLCVSGVALEVKVDKAPKISPAR